MTALILVLAAAALVALLWFGERPGNPRAKWAFKPIASALFIVAALAQGPQLRYDWLIVAGLVLSAVGDLALIPRDRRSFLAGLVAFLLAHVVYTLAFAQHADPLSLPPAGLLLIGLASLVLYLYFRPHLGRMKAPVAAYVAVITAMLVAAWAVAVRSPGPFGWQVAAVREVATQGRRVAEHCDVVMVNIHPFFAPAAVEQAVLSNLGGSYRRLAELYSQTGKPIIVGETGWPSAGTPNGPAVPGLENQKKFIRDLFRYARSNAVGVFVFEMFDEPWKTETGEVGPHWGVFDSHGRAKFALPW